MDSVQDFASAPEQLVGRLPITLPALLDAAAAAPLRHQLQAALAPGEPLRLDGSGVEQVSTLAVQVLLVAAHDAAARGSRLAIAPASAALEEALALLGLRHAFAE